MCFLQSFDKLNRPAASLNIERAYSPHRVRVVEMFSRVADALHDRLNFYVPLKSFEGLRSWRASISTSNSLLPCLRLSLQGIDGG
ncbi:hypothetical protein VTO42DRAFT_5379 [Malbranchea cinnamomea]